MMKLKKLAPFLLGSALLISGLNTVTITNTNESSEVKTSEMVDTPTKVYAKEKGAKSAYDDLYDGDWQLTYADWAVKNGTLAVQQDNTIRVNEDVTESDMMGMIARYIGVAKTEMQPAKIYSELEKIGIVAAGTTSKKAREKIVSSSEGLSLILTMFDNEKFKNRKDKINVLLDEVNADKNATKLTDESNLTKVDVLRILKANESLGKELVLEKPTSNIGSDWTKVLYADERVEAFSYYEQKSGLLITVMHNSFGLIEDDRVVPYYEYLMNKKFTGDKTKKSTAGYLVTVRSVGDKALKLNKLEINAKGTNYTYNDSLKNSTLNGETTRTFVLNSSKLNSLNMTINGVKRDFDLSVLSKIPDYGLYVENKNDNLVREMAYASQNIRDIDYQITNALHLEYSEK